MESEKLLRQANSAMYCARNSGQGKTLLFTQNMQTSAERRLHLEQLLH